MKAVMISIKPEWVEKILSGEKTYEIRKTAPTIKPPFKCYIYKSGTGKVVAEFTCKEIDRFCKVGFMGSREPAKYMPPEKIMKGSCLTEELMEAYGSGAELKAWRIENVKVFERPREIWDFAKEKTGCEKQMWEGCDGCFDCQLMRPPQSWCYVEDGGDAR